VSGLRSLVPSISRRRNWFDLRPVHLFCGGRSRHFSFLLPILSRQCFTLPCYSPTIQGT